MKLTVFLIGFVCFLAAITATVAAKKVSPNECARKVHALPKGRKCKKPCTTTDDCTGKRKKCLCDDICGMSCINPRSKCPKLPKIANAKTRRKGFRYGDKVKYKCHSGFELEGPAVRVCRSDKKWTGEETKCMKKSERISVPSSGGSADLTKPLKEDSQSIGCEEPSSVPNADHDGEKRPFFDRHTRLLFTCRPGFIAEGNPVAICGQGGRWSGPSMICKEACKFPGSLKNGIVVGATPLLSPLDSVLHYECKRGFKLEGSATLKCLRNMQWDGVKPKCLPIYEDKCPPLEQPDHGDMTSYKDNYKPGETVSFSCDLGYSLTGESKRKCLSDFTWSGEEPECKIITCPEPGLIKNGRVEVSKLTYGSVITYRCNTGYTLDGPSPKAACDANGIWSHPLPLCLSACPLPEIPGSRQLLYEGAPFQEVIIRHDLKIHVECESPLTPTSKEPMVCANGHWKNVPRCIHVQKACDVAPPDVQNARTQFYGTKHGDIATYKCRTGFLQRGGDNNIKCTNGRWEGALPYCQSRHCEHRRELKNGFILIVGMVGKYKFTPSVRRIDHGDLIEYYCDPDYKLDGAFAATCINGEWSPKELPRCLDGRYPHFSRKSKS